MVTFGKSKGGFLVIAGITHCHNFLQKKSTMQELGADILMRISIVKIVCDCFLPWQESRTDILKTGFFNKNEYFMQMRIAHIDLH